MAVNNFLDNLASSWEFEETSGNFLDQHGSNNLTPNGVTQGVSGIFGNCGQYDGVNDDAQISNAAQAGLAPGTNSFTMEAWFKTTQSSAGSACLFGKATSPPNRGYSLIVVPNSTVMVQTYDGAVTVDVQHNPAVAPNSGVKHQLVGVQDKVSNLLLLYYDGAPVNSLSIAGMGSVDNLGAFSVGSLLGASFFRDFIDRCRFWNGRALTAGEVLALYNGGNGVAYENFESGEPTPVVLPGTTPFVPSDSIKHILNSGRFQGSIVLDTTNEIGKIRLTSVASLRDTFLTMFKATSKNDIHLNTSAGNKLKAISALDPNTSTSEDIINAVRNS